MIAAAIGLLLLRFRLSGLTALPGNLSPFLGGHFGQPGLAALTAKRREVLLYLGRLSHGAIIAGWQLSGLAVI